MPTRLACHLGFAGSVVCESRALKLGHLLGTAVLSAGLHWVVFEQAVRNCKLAELVLEVLTSACFKL